MNWVLFWLFFHVAGAIIAFGPTFTFPFIGALTARNPQAGHFSAELIHKLERGLILPVAGTMLISGTGLIISSGRNLTKSPWLAAGIILYLTAISIAVFVLLPNTSRLVEATAGGPPPGAPAGAPAGPPPHIAAMIKKNQQFGGVLTALLITIIFLMVVKPGG